MYSAHLMPCRSLQAIPYYLPGLPCIGGKKGAIQRGTHGDAIQSTRTQFWSLARQ